MKPPHILLIVLLLTACNRELVKPPASKPFTAVEAFYLGDWQTQKTHDQDLAEVNDKQVLHIQVDIEKRQENRYVWAGRKISGLLPNRDYKIVMRYGAGSILKDGCFSTMRHGEWMKRTCYPDCMTTVMKSDERGIINYCVVLESGDVTIEGLAVTLVK